MFYHLVTIPPYRWQKKGYITIISFKWTSCSYWVLIIVMIITKNSPRTAEAGLRLALFPAITNSPQPPAKVFQAQWQPTNPREITYSIGGEIRQLRLKLVSTLNLSWAFYTQLGDLVEKLCPAQLQLAYYYQHEQVLSWACPSSASAHIILFLQVNASQTILSLALPLVPSIPLCPRYEFTTAAIRPQSRVLSFEDKSDKPGVISPKGFIFNFEVVFIIEVVIVF